MLLPSSPRFPSLWSPVPTPQPSCVTEVDGASGGPQGRRGAQGRSATPGFPLGSGDVRGVTVPSPSPCQPLSLEQRVPRTHRLSSWGDPSLTPPNASFPEPFGAWGGALNPRAPRRRRGFRPGLGLGVPSRGSGWLFALTVGAVCRSFASPVCTLT